MDESVLDIAGVCLVALLLRTNRAVRFEKEEDIAGLLQKKKLKLPQTGFMDAMKRAKGTIDLSQAVLKCTSFVRSVQVKASSNATLASEETLEKELDDKETYFIKRPRLE